MNNIKTSNEYTLKPKSGWLFLLIEIILIGLVIGNIYCLTKLAPAPGDLPSHPNTAYAVLSLIALAIVAFIYLFGFVVVEPNMNIVCLLFGSYKGTVKDNGFKWVNPFFSKRKVSLRARTLNGEKLKVNDMTGNPIEIAAVIVWKVVDTYEALFEVDNYEQYVTVQSETAIRHLASTHPYDADDENISLRRNTDEVAQALQNELQDRLSRAGVTVLEARLSHLAYSPEIAGAMLRRQQAEAVIAARQRIVEGAVSMVEMALSHLEANNTVKLDEERKAAMVSNLMVVLCSEQAAQPVVNTGTLYQ